tara:strand:- start:241 stop:2778 length:2538 start_codon:yes stop_codon:yes gene_type:complete
MDEILRFISFTNTKFDIVFYCLFSLMPFATLGFMFSKALEKEPSFLINIDRMKGMKNAWTLLLVVTAPLVFIYNVFAWAIWSFVIIAQFIAGLIDKGYKLIIVHILDALKWVYTTLQIENWWKVPKWLFLNVFWIPVVLIVKTVWHYTISWGWDIYSTSFKSLKGTYNYSKLKSGFNGGFVALLILGLSIYLSGLFETDIIGLVGAVICSLPILKACGEITSMNHNEEADHKAHGDIVMKSALKYVIISIGAIVTVHLLLWMSILPDYGLTVLGIAVNTNVFLSSIAILCAIVLAFSGAIFPNYLLYNSEEDSIQGSLTSYLKVIKNKGVQLIAASIPGYFWAGFAVIIPALFIYVSISVSDSFKTDFYSNELASNEIEVTEADDDLMALFQSFPSDSVGISDLQNAYENCIDADLKVQQSTFSLNFPNNVINDSKLIFNTDSTTKYTSKLPDRINDQNATIKSLQEKLAALNESKAKKEEYLQQYESENWSFVVQRRPGDSDDEDDWTTKFKDSDKGKWVDKEVEKGSSYQYRIKAKNKKGSSEWTRTITKTIGDDRLSAPSRLVVKNELNFRNKLYWNDNSYNENKFVIERRSKNSDNEWSDWNILDEVASDINTYTDNKVKTNYTYSYRVFCIGMGDESDPSNVATSKPTIAIPSIRDHDANRVSTMLDWWYDFVWTKASAPRNQKSTANGTVPPFKNNEISFKSELLQEISELENKIASIGTSISKEKELLEMYVSLVDYDKSQINLLKIFKHVASLFAIIFVAIFGGLILSVLYTYFAKLYYKTYTLREKDDWYFITLINEAKAENNNQPLLGFTLLLILSLLSTGSALLDKLDILSMII